MKKTSENMTTAHRNLSPCIRCNRPIEDDDATLCPECRKDPGDDGGYDALDLDPHNPVDLTANEWREVMSDPDYPDDDGQP